MNFQDELINWYQRNKRALPWRNSRDPYVIWLSEVIMQQTRVEQGTPYFERFIERYPAVDQLAAASEEEVLNLWKGLGYYSRGRNMRHTAKLVMQSQGGLFPSGYEQLLRLKGIGNYTAAAISSIAAGERKAVVDGNVYRVLSRYFGIFSVVGTTAGNRDFQQLASGLIEEVPDPGTYNQAVMEYGALVCKPANPLCGDCVIRAGCFALKNNSIHLLPVKKAKKPKRERYISYFVLTADSGIYMRRRPEGDIWQGLYDFPSAEFEGPGEQLMLNEMASMVLGMEGPELHLLAQQRHVLTHQVLNLSFWVVKDAFRYSNKQGDLVLIPEVKLSKTPMPIVIHNFVEEFLGDKYDGRK